MGGPFRRLLAAGAVSDLADGVTRVALPLLAAALTRDPLLVSALTTLAYLPWLLLGLLSGVLVDRVDRRRAMAAANLVRAAVAGALGLAVAAGAAGLPLLYAAAFVLGAAETVQDSAARAALPQLVRRDRLDRGNSLVATAQVVGQSFLGAPVGAALFAAAAAAPLLANAAGYALSAALVLTIRRDLRPARATRTSVRTDVADGLRWIRHNPVVRDLTLLTGVMAVGLFMPTAVLVLYVLDVLGLSAAGYGLVVTGAGAAAVVGGLAAPWLAARAGRGPGLVAAALVSGLATAGMGLTGTPLAGAALFAAAALAGTVWDVLAVSLRQALVPEALFGRVQGAYRTVVWGAIPVGAVAGGALAGATGVPAVFVVGGAIVVLAAAALQVSLRRHGAALAPAG